MRYSWWKKETEWHRDWKGLFPKEWQEIVHFAENSERHIADVKTDQGLVIEFQHSHIPTEERLSREVFYKKMIWIVDGTRRKNDKASLFKHVESSELIDNSKEERISSQFVINCPLLRDWWESTVPVFFDLGEDRLWVLISKNAKKYFFAIDRNKLISSLLHNSHSNNFEELSKHWDSRIAFHEWHLNWRRGRNGRWVRD